MDLIILFSLSSNSPLYFVPDTKSEVSIFNITLFCNLLFISLFAILIASPSTIAVFPIPGSPIKIVLFLFLLSSMLISA